MRQHAAEQRVKRHAGRQRQQRKAQQRPGQQLWMKQRPDFGRQQRCSGQPGQPPKGRQKEQNKLHNRENGMSPASVQTEPAVLLKEIRNRPAVSSHEDTMRSDRHGPGWKIVLRAERFGGKHERKICMAHVFAPQPVHLCAAQG